MINEIMSGECLEKMKLIADKSINMILCDLPYGKTKNKWDSIIPLDELWFQYKRIIKDDSAIVLTGQDKFSAINRIYPYHSEAQIKNLFDYKWISDGNNSYYHTTDKGKEVVLKSLEKEDDVDSDLKKYLCY